MKHRKTIAAALLCLSALQLLMPARSSATPYQTQVPPWRIASSQGAGGSLIGPTAALGAHPLKKRLTGAIISDSLWGNLLLEIAFDRDPVLYKLAFYKKLLNAGMMTGIYSVSLGTIYQTIYATAVLNPPAGHQDSTAPGIGGIAFSGVAVLTGLSRALLGYELASHIKKRQLELRDNLDSTLAKLEGSHCEDGAASTELSALVGPQASGEWVQIWRASHMSVQARRIGAAEPAEANSPLRPVAFPEKPQDATMIAQTSTLNSVTALAADPVRKKKKSIITDSLWGNLILEFAYDGDPVLHRLTTGLKMTNLATSVGVAAIAGGTLFQGCYAIAALNPPDGHQDSYVPGVTGITLASCTLLTIMSRQFLGHEFYGHIRKRQLMLREKVESLQAKLEDTNCSDNGANNELVALIGKQPAAEWLQMWRGTHRLSTDARRVGMDTARTSGLLSSVESSDGGNNE